MPGKPPLYIGLRTEHDPSFKDKLDQLILGGLTQLLEAYPDHTTLQNMTASAAELMELFNVATPIDGYLVRPSYHVTQLFIGSNKKQI